MTKLTKLSSKQPCKEMGNVGSRNKKRSASKKRKPSTQPAKEASRRKLSRRSVSFRDDPDVCEIETREAAQVKQEPDAPIQQETAQTAQPIQTAHSVSLQSDSLKPTRSVRRIETSQSGKALSISAQSIQASPVSASPVSALPVSAAQPAKSKSSRSVT